MCLSVLKDIEQPPDEHTKHIITLIHCFILCKAGGVAHFEWFVVKQKLTNPHTMRLTSICLCGMKTISHFLIGIMANISPLSGNLGI